MPVSVVLQRDPYGGLQLTDEACSRLDYYFSMGRIIPGGAVTPSGVPILDYGSGRGQPARDVEVDGQTYTGSYGDHYENIPRNHPYLLRVLNELNFSNIQASKGDLFIETLEGNVPKEGLSLWVVAGELGERAYLHEPRREERDIELDRPQTRSVLIAPSMVIPVPQTPGEKRIEEARIEAIALAKAEAQALSERRALRLARDTLDGLASPYDKDQALNISRILQKAVIFSAVNSTTKKTEYFVANPAEKRVSRIPFEEKPSAFKNEATAMSVIEDYLRLSSEDASPHVKAIVKQGVATQREIDENQDVQAFLSPKETSAADSTHPSFGVLEALSTRDRFKAGVRPPIGDEIPTKAEESDLEHKIKPR